MKKRYIAIISVSTIGLLFGSLIYCAISAFPELLVEEEAEQVETKHHLHVDNVEIIANNDAASDEAETIIISNSPNKADQDFNISISDANLTKIKQPKIISFIEDNSSFESPSILLGDFFHMFEEPQEATPVVETIEVQESHSMSSGSTHNAIESVEENRVIKTKHAKAKVNKYNDGTHNQIAECSLIVIGAIDIISMLLLRHRKRKLLR